jgi:protocatechuate 3,4-dioxygenase beta subunit
MRKLLLPSLIAFIAVGTAVGLMIASGSRLERIRDRDLPGPVKSAATSPLAPPSLGGQGSDAKQSPERSDEESKLSPISGAQLHGKVTDEEGEALAQAKVYVLLSGDLREGSGRTRLFRERLLGRAAPPTPRVVAEADTGAGGLYSIPIASIPPGTYEVFARHLEHAPRSETWTWSSESAEINFRLGDGDSIAGSVVDPDHQPVAGATVEAFLEEEGDVGLGWGLGGGPSPDPRGAQEKVLADRMETDSEGNFRLWVSAGRFQLTASAKGYSKATQREVSAGTSDLEIVLQPGKAISGRVVDQDVQAVPQARVSLFKAPAREFMPPGGGRDFGPGNSAGAPAAFLRLFRSPEAITESDASGRFRFDDVGSGRYVVFGEKEGFVPAQAEGELGADHETLTLDLSLEPGKLITGTVSDPAGKPVARAFVLVGKESPADDGARFRRGRRGGEGEAQAPQAPGAGNPPPGAEAKVSKAPRPLSPFRAAAALETDDSGHFRFDTLKAGTYSLSIQSEEFLPHRQDGLELKESLQVDAVLESGIRLEGKILSGMDGKPVPAAKIKARLGGDERKETVSDDEGHYRISGIVPGRMEAIEVSAAGFSVLVVEALEVSPEPEAQLHDFQLTRSALLSGVVTDSRGSPIPNARVGAAPLLEEGKEGGRAAWQARRIRGLQSTQRRTSAEGKFSIPEVSSGPSIQVSIEHPDFKPLQSEPFTLKPAEQLQDLHFTLQAGGRLEVLVVSPDGAKSPGARVFLSPRREEDPAKDAETATRRGREPPRDRRGAARSAGPDGKAIFSGLEDGSYMVSIGVKACQPFSAAVSILADQTSSLTAQLLPENAITGVLEDRSGAAVAGARVEALAKAPEPGRPRSPSEARTDENGAFRVGGLGEGPYPVRFRKEGFAELTLASVEVNTDVRPVLERLGGISGHVLVAETGQPVTQFSVRLKEDREAGMRRDPKGFSDPEGAFLLANLPPGSYLIQVTGEDLWGAEVRVNVEDGRVTEGVEVQLVEGLSILGAVVEKGTMAPVSGVEIFLLPLKERARNPADDAPKRERGEERRADRERIMAERRAGRPAADKVDAEAALAGLLLKAASQGGNVLAVTDEAGGFQLKDVPPGRYVLVASHDAFVPGRQNIMIGEDRITRAVRIELEKGESLSGTLSLPDNSLVAGAMVSLRDSTGLVKKAQSDGRGKYLVQGLVPGSYLFSVRTGSTEKSGPFEVKIRAGSNRLDYQIGSNPR